MINYEMKEKKLIKLLQQCFVRALRLQFRLNFFCIIILEGWVKTDKAESSYVKYLVLTSLILQLYKASIITSINALSN